ncbi:MAG: hypothetical protein K6F36_01500 [Bacilli bacterium]|nr:hypothetical protein [Bacilli bacterium]
MRRKKGITIIIGFNLVTTLLPLVLGFFEFLVVFVQVMRGISTGEWGLWIRCLYWLIGFVAIWLVAFFIALIVLKKRLIIEGHTLRITQGKETLYQCDISEIRAVHRERFSPLLNAEPGSITIINPDNPVPKKILLLMSWASYKKITNYIKMAKQSFH